MHAHTLPSSHCQPLSSSPALCGGVYGSGAGCCGGTCTSCHIILHSGSGVYSSGGGGCCSGTSCHTIPHNACSSCHDNLKSSISDEGDSNFWSLVYKQATYLLCTFAVTLCIILKGASVTRPISRDKSIHTLMKERQAEFSYVHNIVGYSQL